MNRNDFDQFSGFDLCGAIAGHALLLVSQAFMATAHSFGEAGKPKDVHSRMLTSSAPHLQQTTKITTPQPNPTSNLHITKPQLPFPHKTHTPLPRLNIKPPQYLAKDNFDLIRRKKPTRTSMSPIPERN